MARQVADMDAADDGSQVVLAMGLERDVAQHHDLVVAGDLVEGAAEIVARVLRITGEPLLISARDTTRRSGQPLAVGIVAGPADERAHSRLRLAAGRTRGRPRYATRFRPAITRGDNLTTSLHRLL